MSKLFANMTEYSKQRLDLMIRLWIIGAFFGATIVVVEIVLNIACMFSSELYAYSIPIHLPDLLVYVGAPITGGIVTYLIKSALENVSKGKNRVFDPVTNNNPDEP